jgi:hypothetical protein
MGVHARRDQPAQRRDDVGSEGTAAQQRAFAQSARCLYITGKFDRSLCCYDAARREEAVTHGTARQEGEFAVIGPKGERAIVVALPSPSHALMDDSKPELVYGIDGLTVERISDTQFRDFRGTVWTIDGALSSR